MAICSSPGVYDCFSLEGDAMGDCPFFVGEWVGVVGLPPEVIDDEGEDGRRKGEARGELKERLVG